MKTAVVLLSALVTELASRATGMDLAPTIALVSGVYGLVTDSEKAMSIAAGSGAVLGYHAARSMFPRLP